MKQALLAGCVAVAVSAFAATAHAADQEAINKAVERGAGLLAPRRRGQSRFQFDLAIRRRQRIGGSNPVGVRGRPGRRSRGGILESVRSASTTMHETYTLSLSILFLDRLGDPADVPLIESMTVRLMAGQGPGGGWSYTCPNLSQAEVRRLTAHLKEQARIDRPA